MDDPVAGVLSDEDRESVQLAFGVDSAQVVRDHIISHALAAIAALGSEDLIFFGGTALARTLLPALRLSEDIDLIAVRHRDEAAERIERSITRSFRRTLGAATFTPSLRETRGSVPSILEARATRVQIQLLSATGRAPWPTEVVSIEQRYRDAPAAALRVLTPPAFVAAKLSAWADRAAPRDLYDLWALAEAGLFTEEAAHLFARHGPYSDIRRVPFSHLPTPVQWERALGHQGRLRTTLQNAAAVVASALAALTR
ncbi:nucleotidyl transferase AbiEii/AbiGii toxin family protein [Microbacterium resistens]|uniref:Nucleotidyl transferase AbiEii/AbiGii toxin family protein n=1 Tax=Microbacterium resistens TaxID=156977 RepID=A0ABY3RS43_9MICO|nr:nucleotidyl transferase AbiEii/AbiGii toxin family protein [Microbacterium resistens]UGS25312.1 nucleotidyl transferase AbiEii/AbiGii toxin family protein [Microbacterium resistens]